MQVSRRFVATGLATAGVLALMPRAARAQGYYEGKTLTMIVPHTPSGVYGQYAQLLGPHIGKALKARGVRIETHTGAGGILGSNLVWLAKPDGMTFGLSSGSSLMLAQLAGSAGVQFDATKFTYLGRPTADDRVITVGANSPIKGVEDIRKLGRPFRVPSQGTDEDFYSMAILANTLGFEVQYITGYEGNSDTSLAVIKGDGDGMMNSWPAALPSIKAGDTRPILTVSTQRFPGYPDVAPAMDFAPNPEKAKTLKALIDIQSLHRTFFGPPGMDPTATDELRAAIMKVLTDSEVIAAAERMQAPLKPMDGATQQKLVAQIYAASGDLTGILKAAVQSIK